MATKFGWCFLVLAFLLLVSFAVTRPSDGPGPLDDTEDAGLGSSILASPEPSDQPPLDTSDAPSTTGETGASDETTSSSTDSIAPVGGEAVFQLAQDLASDRGVPTEDAPIAPTEGCTGDCPVVGFQDLSNQQGVVLENVVITNPAGVCLDLRGASDIIVRNVSIVGCGTEQAVDGGYSAGLVNIEDAQNITIENSLIRDISNKDFGANRNNAIEIHNSSNVTIRSNFLGDVHSNIGDKSGDRGSRSIYITGASSGITIDNNRFSNAGRNAVQMNRVRNATSISITNNLIEGRARWDSDYEDMINLFSSSGTPDDPILISGNTMRNGGPSSSGTGIILGDGNASVGPTQYVVAENNVLINPGHVGINLAGGDNITIRDNIIVGTGDVPHPTTVGMTINDFGYSAECRDHVVSGNQVWMDNQHTSGGTNHVWNPGTCTNNVQLSDNLFGG